MKKYLAIVVLLFSSRIFAQPSEQIKQQREETKKELSDLTKKIQQEINNLPIQKKINNLQKQIDTTYKNIDAQHAPKLSALEGAIKTAGASIQEKADPILAETLKSPEKKENIQKIETVVEEAKAKDGTKLTTLYKKRDALLAEIQKEKEQQTSSLEKQLMDLRKQLLDEIIQNAAIQKLRSQQKMALNKLRDLDEQYQQSISQSGI